MSWRFRLSSCGASRRFGVASAKLVNVFGMCKCFAIFFFWRAIVGAPQIANLEKRPSWLRLRLQLDFPQVHFEGWGVIWEVLYIYKYIYSKFLFLLFRKKVGCGKSNCNRNRNHPDPKNMQHTPAATWRLRLRLQFKNPRVCFLLTARGDTKTELLQAKN